MPDFAKKSPGDGLVLAAADWNAAMDAARDHFARKGPGATFGPLPLPITPQITILVRNDTGADLAAPFAVLRVAAGTPLEDVTAESNAVRLRPALPADTPASAEDAVVITIEPIAAGAIGRAAIAGAVPVKVEKAAAGDEWAGPLAGDHSQLAGGSGPVRLLWSESGTGTKWAVVLLAGFPACCATEDGATNTGTAGAGATVVTDTFDVSAGEVFVTLAEYADPRQTVLAIAPGAGSVVVDAGITVDVVGAVLIAYGSTAPAYGSAVVYGRLVYCNADGSYVSNASGETPVIRAQFYFDGGPGDSVTFALGGVGQGASGGTQFTSTGDVNTPDGASLTGKAAVKCRVARDPVNPLYLTWRVRIRGVFPGWQVTALPSFPRYGVGGGWLAADGCCAAASLPPPAPPLTPPAPPAPLAGTLDGTPDLDEEGGAGVAEGTALSATVLPTGGTGVYTGYHWFVLDELGSPVSFSGDGTATISIAGGWIGPTTIRIRCNVTDSGGTTVTVGSNSWTVHP